jgi:hypothetical protein
MAGKHGTAGYEDGTAPTKGGLSRISSSLYKRRLSVKDGALSISPEVGIWAARYSGTRHP